MCSSLTSTHTILITRSAKLNDLPEDDEGLSFGNSCYRVQFTERRHKGVYGHQYSFFLQDAVEDVPEYLVEWNNFVE
jgi:mRNA (guanine-N7-)-methyltransferase